MALAEPPETAAQIMPPGTPGEIQPPARPVSLRNLRGIHWSIGIRAAVLAGLISAVAAMITSALTRIPQLSLFMWMLGGGIISVLLYRRTLPLHFTSGMGAKLGAVSGLIAFGFFAILYSIQTLAFHAGPEIRSLLEQQLREQAARSGDPATQEIVGRLLTPEGITVAIMIGLVFSCFLFIISSALGGAMTAWMTKDQSDHHSAL